MEVVKIEVKRFVSCLALKESLTFHVKNNKSSYYPPLPFTSFKIPVFNRIIDRMSCYSSLFHARRAFWLLLKHRSNFEIWLFSLALKQVEWFIKFLLSYISSNPKPSPALFENQEIFVVEKTKRPLFICFCVPWRRWVSYLLSTYLCLNETR